MHVDNTIDAVENVTRKIVDFIKNGVHTKWMDVIGE